MILVILVISFFTFLSIILYIKFSRTLHLAKAFKGPPSLPIIGHGHLFVGKSPYQYLILVSDIVKKYGIIVKIWIGSELNILTSDLNDIEVILGTTKFNDKASEYRTMIPWLNQGLLVSRGKKWFKRRKIITPAFHFKILEQFIEVFHQESSKMVDILNIQISSNSFDLYFFVNACTLDVICESAMGVSVNAQTNTDSEYVKAVKTISTVLHKRMFDIFYRFDFTYWFTKLAREEKKALKILHGFTEKIIVQRREEILKEKEKLCKNDLNEVGAKRKMAFLDILLQSEIDGKPLSNLDIREEVDTFMFEGHDTTSSAITFFFYNIGRYMDAQNKCFQEIFKIFGRDKNQPVTYENLNKLHYTELCIKETLRLFPSVPLLGRRVTEECEINGKIIPAGANIGISPLHLGRMEEIFPNANEFIPERFEVVKNAEKMNPYAYIPFSAGPRNCIGQKFAMLEIKSVIANVLRNFEIKYVQSGPEEPLLVGELILRTRDPLLFKLKPRVYI